jgi:putative hydrolase of the HAD superfamily
MPEPAAPVLAVLFDYGLVLTGPPDPGAWAKMQEITGLSEESFAKAYWARRIDYDRGLFNGRNYFLDLGQSVDLTFTPTQVDQLIAADNILWTQINQPMVDWALRLQAAGTRTGILSNLGDDMMHGVLATLPWMANFHHRTFSHLLKIAKPDLAIYRHAAEGMEMPPENILFVDDKEENIAGALAYGMQGIQYQDHATFEHALLERGLGELWRSGKAQA